MSTFNIIANMICILIGEYNYEHLLYMTHVMDELLHKHYFKIHRDHLT